MRFNSVRISLAALAIAVCPAAGIASAQTADYELHRFDDGPGWLVFDEDVDIALQVLNPDDPQCHEIGEIILLFETPNQLGDADLIEAAALDGMERYSELCRAFDGTPSNQRRVSGIIIGEREADARGRIMGEAKVLDAMVTSLTGSPEFRIRRISTVSDEYADDRVSVPVGDQEQASGRDQEIAEIRATFGIALTESMAEAEPVGALARMTGGDGVVQWWRASNDDAGLLPWRSGAWELRGGTLIMTFDRRVEYDDFLGLLRDSPIDETVQFDLKNVDDSELRLAATGGGFSPEALFLGGAEKLFVRCEG